MKVTAIIPDELIKEVKKLTKGKNTTDMGGIPQEKSQDLPINAGTPGKK